MTLLEAYHTGREIGDEEINLEFQDGDWRIPDVDEEADESFFVSRITNLVGDKSQWEWTATELSEATCCDIAQKWITRKLNEHRAELESAV